jgi:hypothetical protein
MENYASDDPGPAFLIGHHESNRSMAVTTDTIFKVHESNVGSPSCAILILIHQYAY